MMKIYMIWNRIWLAWGINAVNGMSAMSNLFGLYYALFGVAFTNYYIVYWTAMSYDVDQSLDEKKLPYKMADLYAYCRSEILNYNRYYAYVIISSAIPILFTLLCSYETEYTGAMNEDGHSQGFIMLGVINLWVAVLFHHLWLVFMTNQFNWTFIPMMIFSFCWIWIVSLLEDAN